MPVLPEENGESRKRRPEGKDNVGSSFGQIGGYRWC